MKSNKNLYYVPVIFVISFLITTWSIVVVIDFCNLFDLQNFFQGKLRVLPLLWFHIFAEGKVAENIQWLLQGVCAFISLSLIFRFLKLNLHEYVVCFFALTAGSIIMVVEDSLNIRHHVSDYYLPIFLNVERVSRNQRMAWEVSFYIVLSALMIFPIIFLFAKKLLTNNQTNLWLIFSYGVYGLVGFGSALRGLGYWQENLGNWLIERLNLAELPSWAYSLERMEFWRENLEVYNYTLGYLLVDHLVEESVELLAIGLLTTSLLLVRRDLFVKMDAGFFEQA